MNIYASSASQRRGARETSPETGPAAVSREIKYRQDAAGYVTAMLAELRQIAGKAGFDRLVRSLDAAYYEAYGALDARSREVAPPAHAGTAGSAPEIVSNSPEPKAP